MQTTKVSRHTPAAGLTVLVVSADERKASRVCRIVRRDRRFRLLGWVGSKDGLASSPQEPDVALVDLLLPGLNAWDSMAAYKRCHPGCVVAVWSDLDVPYLRSVGLAAGADAYVVLGPTDRGLSDFLAAHQESRQDGGRR
jgi:DNA-binding response OmpR family regulator